MTYKVIGKFEDQRKNELRLVHTYSLWSSVLHDDKFDDKTDAKLASTRYSFTYPTFKWAVAFSHDLRDLAIHQRSPKHWQVRILRKEDYIEEL